MLVVDTVSGSILIGLAATRPIPASHGAGGPIRGKRNIVYHDRDDQIRRSAGP